MAKRVTTKVIEEVETDDEPRAVATPSKRRGLGRWFWRTGFLLALLGVGAFFAPSIVVSTGLWKSLLAQAAPPLAGKVEVGSLSLGWFAPIVIKDLTLLDAEGATLAQVASFRTERTLLELARNQTDLGKFIVDDPRVVITLRADGSNLEDLIAQFSPTKEPATLQASPAFALELTRGTVELDDQVAGSQWQLSGVNAEFLWPSDPQLARTGKLTAALKRSGGEKAPQQPAGDIAAQLNWMPSAPSDKSPAGLGSGIVKCQLTALPVEVAEGALRRYVADIRPAGAVTGNAIYEWKDDLQAQRVELTKLRSPQFSLTSPMYLTSDRLSTKIANLSGGLELNGQRVVVDKLLLESDLAAFSASAEAEISTYDLSGILASLQSKKTNEGVEVSGEIDLAAVTRQLSATLRIRKDTRINDGLLQVSIKSGLQGGDRAWQARIASTKLIAETSGRRFAWDQPIELTAAVRQAKGGFFIDKLTGTSNFARVEGEGTLDKGSLVAEADLDKLVTELGQFVDWTGIDLAGQLKANLQWERGAGSELAANADARVQNFELVAPGLLPWRESDLQIVAELTGQADGTGLTQLATANLSVISAADKLTARLQAPVAEISAKTNWPLAYNLQGDLGTWLPRLQSFVPLGKWQITGGIAVEGAGQFSATRVALEPTKVQLDRLSASGPGVFIQERVVKVDTQGVFDSSAGTFTSPETTLSSSAVAFRADNLQAAFGKSGVSVSGVIDYRGDLSRLSGWIGDAKAPRTWQFGGQMTGRVEASVQQGIVQAAWNSEIENLAYATRPRPAAGQAGLAATPVATTSGWQVAWQEPKVSLGGEGTYDPTKDALTLSSARLDSVALTVAATGSVDQLATRCMADLQGEISCDMVGVTEKLRPFLGETLAITGKEQRKFSVRGPLLLPAKSLSAEKETELRGDQPGTLVATGSQPKGAVGPLVADELTAEGGVAWQDAQYYGLVAGPASLEAQLKQGVVEIGPLDIPLSEGRLTATPRILLNEPQPYAVLDKGPLLDQVRISPELCRGWLKYVSPFLADVTRAEGKFSVSLEGAAVPLMSPSDSDIGGILAIHAAQVGPGPLATQYLGIAQQVRAIIDRRPVETLDPSKGWILLPEQQVEVRMVGQRVYHRGMTMTVKDISIQTEGSVGFDQSVNLVAVIPIQDKWVEQNKLLAGLKGQSLRIPVRGHISKPEFDQAPLAELTKQIVGSAAQGFLKGGLENGKGLLDRELSKGLQGLEKLFGPKP